MAESRIHHDLVTELRHWIAKGMLGSDLSAILVDDGDHRTGPPPPRINGHRPDVYAQATNPDLVVVGEAKTEADLESERSRKQLLSFLRFCQLHSNSCLVVAVPWYAERTAMNMLGNLKSRYSMDDARAVVMPQLLAAAMVTRNAGC